MLQFLTSILAPHHDLYERWLRRRTQQAEKLGIRTPATTVHLYRCRACHHTIEREAPWEVQHAKLAEIPKLLEIIGETIAPSRCANCPSAGTSLEHQISLAFGYLSFSDHHLVLVYRTVPTPDRDTSPSLHAFAYGEETRVLAKPQEQEAQLQRLLAQDAVRKTLSTDPELTPSTLKKRFARDPESQLLALREYGRFWESLNEYSTAFAHFDAYLKLAPDDEKVLQASARILERALEYPEASRRLHRAWMQRESPELLETLARLAYRAQRFDLLKGAATALLENDSDSVCGYLALICSLDARYIVPLRRAFDALHDAAARGGHVGIQQVSASWLHKLSLDLPDWDRHSDAEEHSRAVEIALADAGFEIQRAQPLTVNDTAIEYDLIAVSPEGRQYIFFINESPIRPHIVRALRGQLRALLAHDDWHSVTPILLTPRPIPWYVYRMMSDAADARLELLIDADTMMQVMDENIATFLWAAEEHFGASLDFRLDSLPELDRLITRWHEFGFGEISHVLASLMASYLGEIFQRHVGGQWVDTDNGPDARAWQLPDETTVYLIAHVRHCVALGGDETIAGFVQAVLHGER